MEQGLRLHYLRERLMPIKCLNTKIAIAYIELMGKDTDKVLKGFPLDRSYLSNPNNKITLEQELEFFRRCKIELDDEDATFWMGAFSYYLGAAKNMEPVFKFLGSPAGIIKLTTKLSRFFNDEISYRMESIDRGSAVIICTYGDHIDDPGVDIDGCKYTKGIYSAIPTVWNKNVIGDLIENRPNRIENIPGLISVHEVYHASKERPHCKYELTIPQIILPRQIFRRVRSYFDLMTRAPDIIEEFDKKQVKSYSELKEAYDKLDESHEKLAELNLTLEKRVEERTAELKQTQTKLLESEKRSLEHRITGGFAHEMRNALAGAQLEFKTTLNYQDKGKTSAELLKDSATALLKNISDIHQEFGIPREKIASHFIPELKTIANIADHLSETISGVSRDLDRGLSITSQIRDYAKMSEFKAGDTQVDIIRLLKGYENQYRREFDEHGIQYSVSGVGTAVVKADETHLNSIFSNLVLNAKDALADNEIEAPQISVSVENIDKQILVKVSDNGPGIQQGHLKEIFEPFFSTKPTSGTGLGLGIVKRMAQLYSGQVDVESKIGVGTIFTITLPGDNNG